MTAQTVARPRPLGGAAGRATALGAAAVLLWLGTRTNFTAGTPLSRSLALAALPLVLPVCRWAVEPPSRATFIALTGGLLAGPVRSLFYDPIRDAGCRGCLPGAFAVLPDVATAQGLVLVGDVLVVAGLWLAVALRPAPVVLAVLAVLPLLGEAVAAARWAVVVATVSLGVELVRRWWSSHQLADLVRGLNDAASLDVARVMALDARADLPRRLRLGLAQAKLRLALAEQAAQIADSRRRIAARADQEARRLERDLHDGAQQHLLALALTLATEPPTPRQADALRQARACIDDLRAVARQVYPPVLESGGLRPALASLPGGRLTVLDVPQRRFGAATERTAYLVVEDIYRRAAEPVAVTGHVEGQDLTIAIDGPPPPPESLIHDRVGALGGTLEVVGDRTVVRLPCG